MTDTSPLSPDDPETAAVALVRLAITAKCASEVGWPHLATAAARECRALIDRIVVALSPACARTTVDEEFEQVGGISTLGAALALLYGRALDESGEVEP
jgi:hypothetical protein